MTSTIVLACDTFNPDHNGTATFAKNLACALQSQKFEVHVIAPATSGLYGTFRESHDGVPLIVHRLKSRRLPFQPAQRFVNPIGLTSKLEGLIRAIAPDVVHIQSHLNIGHHAASAASNSSIRLVATNHLDTEHLVDNVLLGPQFLKQFVAKALLRDAARIFRAADVVVAPTRRAAEILNRVIPGKHIYAISGGVDLARFEDLPKAVRDDFRITYVGRLDREKHVYVLLKAIELLPQKMKLDIVGSGSQESELLALAKELQIEDRVTFFHDLDDSAVTEKLGQASVFVMPSVQELQSMATLEAMAAGRPIVAADAMALPLLVVSGSNGYLYRPDSALDLAFQLQKLFSLDEKSFDEMGSNSKLRAQRHDLASTVQSYARIYAGVDPSESDVSQGSDYSATLGVGERLASLVKRGTAGVERGANGVLERLDGVRGSVVETFQDVRFTIERRGRRVAKKISNSLRKALEALRRDD